MQKQQTATQTVRRQDPAKWVYPNIATNLMNQVDRAVESLKPYGANKYANRRHFIETAIKQLLEKEGVKEVSA